MSRYLPAKNHKGNSIMKKSIITILVFLTVPAAAQNAPLCDQTNGGQLLPDPASGRPFICDGAGNWIAATDVPHSASAGEWRFNPQTRLMEYFDGQQWIAVSPKAP